MIKVFGRLFSLFVFFTVNVHVLSFELNGKPVFVKNPETPVQLYSVVAQRKNDMVEFYILPDQLYLADSKSDKVDLEPVVDFGFKAIKDGHDFTFSKEDITRFYLHQLYPVWGAGVSYGCTIENFFKASVKGSDQYADPFLPGYSNHWPKGHEFYIIREVSTELLGKVKVASTLIPVEVVGLAATYQEATAIMEQFDSKVNRPVFTMKDKRHNKPGHIHLSDIPSNNVVVEWDRRIDNEIKYKVTVNDDSQVISRRLDGKYFVNDFDVVSFGEKEVVIIGRRDDRAVEVAFSFIPSDQLEGSHYDNVTFNRCHTLVKR